MKKNNKGFTIIELIVVVAIIGIIVLLASSSLKGQVEKARLTRIRHDVKVTEDVAEISRGDGKSYGGLTNTSPISLDLEKLSNLGILYDKKGLVTSTDPGDDRHWIVTKEENRSNLDGYFYVDKDGKGYYVKEDIAEDILWHYYTDYTGEDEIKVGRNRKIGAGEISEDRTGFFFGKYEEPEGRGRTGINLDIKGSDNKTGMAVIPEKESYGEYEARIKLPEQKGLLNGFFMYGENGSTGKSYEIDMEMLIFEGEWELWMTIHNEGHPDYVYGKYLENYDPNKNYSPEGGLGDPNYAEPGVIFQKKVKLKDYDAVPTYAAGEYHNYKIDYNEDYIAFYINDVEVGRWNGKFGKHDMEIIASTFWVNWLDKYNGQWDEQVSFEWIRKKLIY